MTDEHDGWNNAAEGRGERPQDSAPSPDVRSDATDMTGAGNDAAPQETAAPATDSAQTGAPQTEGASDAASQTDAPDDTPDYASAKGEQTVVSSAPASSSPEGEQSTQSPYGPDSPYRPAPEYGAYGPVPTQPGQPGQQPGQPAPQGPGAPGMPGGPQQGMPYPPQGPGMPPQGQPAAGGNPYYANPFADPNRGPQQPGRPAPQGAPGQYPGMPQPGAPGAPGPVRTAERKPLGATARAVIAAAVAAVVVAALCLGFGYAAIVNGWVTVPSSGSLASISSNQSGSGSAKVKSGEAPDWQAVAKDVSPTVVSIQTVMQNGSAKGSGAIIDASDGTIVTNNHVISGAQQIQVTLSNGQMYAAKVVGTDNTTDLAVIRLQNAPSDLKAVEFADSDKLAVGENIMAVGNPLGYDDTATTGIVSALNRPVSVMDEDGSNIVTNAVQIDAAVNPGNSGGPTFNAAGQVIGINSSIASTASSSESAGSIGIGFAIPSNLVKRVANEIVKDGKVQHVALGVTVKTAMTESDGVARAGAQVVTPSTGGTAVVPGGPAAEAGLKANDTIVAFDGNAVNSSESLLGFVRAAAMGSTAKLTIVRDGKTMEVDVKLDQAEQAVNGSNKSESNGNGRSQNGQNGQGDGQSINPYGQGNGGGGLFDPFGLW